MNCHGISTVQLFPWGNTHCWATVNWHKQLWEFDQVFAVFHMSRCLRLFKCMINVMRGFPHQCSMMTKHCKQMQWRTHRISSQDKNKNKWKWKYKSPPTPAQPRRDTSSGLRRYPTMCNAAANFTLIRWSITRNQLGNRASQVLHVEKSYSELLLNTRIYRNVRMIRVQKYWHSVSETEPSVYACVAPFNLIQRCPTRETSISVLSRPDSISYLWHVCFQTL